MRAFILSVLLLCLLSTICNGQFNEVVETTSGKKFFIGGSFNFDKSENTSSTVFLNNIINTSISKNNSYSFNPSLGYQVSKNWILGLDIFLDKRKSERGDFPDDFQIQESSSNSIGVYARYIFNPQHKFQFYANPYIRRTSEESSFTFSSMFNNNMSKTEGSSNSVNLGLSFGVQYEFASWVRATTNVGGLYYSRGSIKNVGFNSTNVEEDLDFDSYGFNLRASSIYFGLEFLF